MSITLSARASTSILLSVYYNKNSKTEQRLLPYNRQGEDPFLLVKVK